MGDGLLGDRSSTDMRVAHLVVGAQFHDDDLVRRKLLNLLGEDDRIRAHCYEDFNDLRPLQPRDLLITYTHNTFPNSDGLAAIRHFLDAGGRWLAFHATAACTEFVPPPVRAGTFTLPGRTDTPDRHPEYMGLIGCRMLAHLPVRPFIVRPTALRHPLIEGVEAFEVTDEPFILEVRDDVITLLESSYAGDSPGYVKGPWWEDLPRPQMTLRRQGSGAVVYVALGHARGRFDLRPFLDVAEPFAGPWGTAAYVDLIRRIVTWSFSAEPLGADR